MSESFKRNPRAWAEGVVTEAFGPVPDDQLQGLVVPLIYVVRQDETLQAAPESAHDESQPGNVSLLAAQYKHMLEAHGWSAGQLHGLVEYTRQRIREELE